MRIGHNPEKHKNSLIEYKTHRIIIPVFIPDGNEEYFKKSIEVFKKSIDSLLNTIDKDQTLITIVNNDSNKEVTDYINWLLEQKLIDKHSRYSLNYGKVYAVISEAKASYESLITIADADVFYFTNWQYETIKAFNLHKKAGVISPLPTPQIALYNNVSLFSNFFCKKKRDNIVSNESFKLFRESVGKPADDVKKEWQRKQYYLEKNGNKICIGAGHFVATYRGNVLRQLPFLKPSHVFKNGYENDYLDQPIDKMGYYRLSLKDTYAYHLGNSIPKWVTEYRFDDLENASFKNLKFKSFVLPYSLRFFIFRIYKKLFLKNS